MRISLGLILIITLIAGGALLALRTQWGMQTLLSLAGEILAAQGLFLSYDTVEGPLPSRLRLTGLRLADSRGLFFRSDAAELSIVLAALPDKEIRVETLALVKPELLRLPELPLPAESGADPEAETVPAPLKGGRLLPGVPQLPVAVHLDSLSIDGARLALNAESPLILDAAGTAELVNGHLAATFSLALTTGEGRLDLDSSLSLEESGALQASGTLRASAAVPEFIPGFMGESPTPEPDTVQDRISADMPARMAGAWRFFWAGNETDALEVAVEGLDLHSLGVVLSGDLSARVPMPLPAVAAFGLESGHWPTGLSLDGALAATVDDWSGIAGLAELAGLALAGDGARLAADFSHDGGTQRLGLALDLASLRLPSYGNLALNAVDLNLNAALGTGTPVIHASLDLGPGRAGAIPQTGPLPGAWSGAHAVIDSEGPAGTFALRVLEDAAAPNTAGVGELLTAAGDYDLRAMTLGLHALTFRHPASDRTLALIKPTSLSLADGISAREFSLDLGGSGTLSADLSQRGGVTDLTARLDALSLDLLNSLLGTALPPGALNGTARFRSGTVPQGALHAELLLDGLGGDRVGNPGPTLSLDAALVRERGRLKLQGGLNSALLIPAGFSTSPVETASATPSGGEPPLVFSIPLSVSPAGFPAPRMNGPLAARFLWQGDVAPYWRFVPMPERDLRGLVRADLSVGGTLAAPTVQGAVYAASGRFEDKALGVLLTDITLEARAVSNTEFHLALSASDGGTVSGGGGDGVPGGMASGTRDPGAIALEGSLDLAAEEPLALRGQVRHLSPLHRDDLSITFSGLFGAHGSLSAPTLTAQMLVERGEILLLSSLLSSSSVPTLDVRAASDPEDDAETVGGGPVLDIQVDVPRRFFIRGRGLDSEWQGSLHVAGTALQPDLRGSLAPVRGTFDLLSRTFQFTSGDIEFAGGTRVNPAVDLELSYYGADLTAIVRATGNADKPSLTLDSTPPLPQDEILAQVLFGKRVSELSRFEMIQLANGLRELTGIGGSLDPFTSMRKATGLDVLRVGSGGDDPQAHGASGLSGGGNLPGQTASPGGGEGGSSLEAGKYLSDSIYIGVEQGLTQEETAVRVEVELLPNVTLQGRSSTESSQAGIGWKKDY